jgi:hypothetical protein
VRGRLGQLAPRDQARVLEALARLLGLGNR